MRCDVGNVERTQTLEEGTVEYKQRREQRKDTHVGMTTKNPCIGHALYGTYIATWLVS